MVVRVALAAGAVLAALVLGAALFTLRPDISLAHIKSRYGSLVLSNASAFVALGDGHAVHVGDEGERQGLALVLLHDADSSLHSFEPWVASLGRNYRVVSLDLPGHGLTGPIPGADESAQAMVPVLDGVASKLGLTRFALAGVGMGGELALRYARAHPGRVSALVLIAPQGLPEPEAISAATPFFSRFARVPLLGKLARYANLKGYVRAKLKRDFFDDARVRDDMVARAWLMLRCEGNREALLARLSYRAADSFVGDLGGIDMPVLILWGAEDEVTPVSDAMRYQGALPQAALVVFETVGHFVHEEAAVDSAAVVNSFLRGEPVGTAASETAMRRVYGNVPPLPAMPIKPVEIRPLAPPPEPVRLPSP
jgi:pimeloyl-ACP methyl ester carboxylesterase